MGLSGGEGFESTKTRVAIVGAGPFGLELAVALAREGVSFELFDAGSLGHTISWWAPQTRWFSSNERISIADVPLVTLDQTKATREQYLAYLRAVAEQFQIRVRTHEPVVEILRGESGFSVVSETRGGQRLVTQAERIVLAIGGLSRPAKLGIEGETLGHVSGVLGEPHQYFGRRVLVIGGRNSAVEAALRLYHAGADVRLSYRRPALPRENIKYWLLPEIEGLIRNQRIQAFLGTRPVKIMGDEVELVSVAGESAAESFRIGADHVLSLIGYEQDKTLFRGLGLELAGDQQRPVLNERTLESSIPGVYVGGTAIGGTQSSGYQVFLENCHEHVDLIVSHITGREIRSPRRALQAQIASAPES